MDFEKNIREILKLTAILSNKDSNEVYVTYKGTSNGITKPWQIRCGNNEIVHETSDGAAAELVKTLKKELLDRIISTERQAADYKKALGNLEN